MLGCVVLPQSRFVAGGGDMWVHLHDAETGAELEVNKGHHGPVHTVRCGISCVLWRLGGEGVDRGPGGGTWLLQCRNLLTM